MSQSTGAILAELLGKALLLDGQKLATAESCTGGGLAYNITSVAGSSQWFERGFITYSNESKQQLLGVPTEILETFGAVSEQTAAAMAQGAIDNSRAEFSVAITGIAGPDGGTNEKPVGTVCLAWSIREGETKATQVVFEGDRQRVREQAILIALQGLLDLIKANNS